MSRSFEVPEMLESSQLAQDDEEFVWDDEGAEERRDRICVQQSIDSL